MMTRLLDLVKRRPANTTVQRKASSAVTPAKKVDSPRQMMVQVRL